MTRTNTFVLFWALGGVTLSGCGSSSPAAGLRRFRGQLHHGPVEFTLVASVQRRAARLRAEADLHFREAGLVGCDA
jgi:hypothetical protein